MNGLIFVPEVFAAQLRLRLSFGALLHCGKMHEEEKRGKHQLPIRGERNHHNSKNIEVLFAGRNPKNEKVKNISQALLFRSRLSPTIFVLLCGTIDRFFPHLLKSILRNSIFPFLGRNFSLQVLQKTWLTDFNTADT